MGSAGSRAHRAGPTGLLSDQLVARFFSVSGTGVPPVIYSDRRTKTGGTPVPLNESQSQGRCVVDSWVVSCESCEVNWPRLGEFSEYEREAIESRPCPRCGAYTLSCSGAEPVRTRRGTRLGRGDSGSGSTAAA